MNPLGKELPYSAIGSWVIVFVVLGCRSAPLREAPVQPVAFSHKVHAGEYGLDCQFCHAYARRSPVAGTPSLRRCEDCHRPMALKNPELAASNPEVQKLLGFFQRKEAIPWVRVHDLPDHVYFSHRVHIQAEVRCQTCHGPVETMERVKQAAPLTMGWCVHCHLDHKASRDCIVCHK